ncbi:head completion/stabilization protein [Lysobacter capsici]|uniref:head completion/stabilization protein n=1 Tax=Lysobacter capsici TaxID=435897 RepID=UPI00177BF7AB|nr:head completion/stabilization protein [Lysobacter capsici]UOF16468.1 head completion/stabilization protein [Lysobacter capsici]
MSGFIANGNAGDEAVIANSEFWPSIDPIALRAAMRIDGAVAPDRLRSTIVAVALEVNADLAKWRAQQQNAGFEKLNDVPSEHIDGVSRLAQLYLRAIACGTAAELAQRYRSYDTAAAGDKRADDLTPSIDELRRDLRFAVRDFLGASRITVELI